MFASSTKSVNKNMKYEDTSNVDSLKISILLRKGSESGFTEIIKEIIINDDNITSKSCAHVLGIKMTSKENINRLKRNKVVKSREFSVSISIFKYNDSNFSLKFSSFNFSLHLFKKVYTMAGNVTI